MQVQNTDEKEGCTENSREGYTNEGNAEETKIDDQLSKWLSQINLSYLYQPLQAEGVRKLEDFLDFKSRNGQFDDLSAFKSHTQHARDFVKFKRAVEAYDFQLHNQVDNESLSQVNCFLTAKSWFSCIL